MKQRVLERVDAVVAHGRLVQRRDVPDVEVERPQRERDDRVGEEAQPADQRIRSTGASSGPVSPRTSSSAARSAEQQVLGHVGPESSSPTWPSGGERQRR